jgi:hypothetical protein
MKPSSSPPAQPSSSRWKQLVIGALIVILFPLVVFLLRSSGDAPRRAQVDAGPATAARQAWPTPPPVAPASQPDSQPASFRVKAQHPGWTVWETTSKATTPEERQAAAEMARNALEDYLKFAKYPPWSRPADDSQTHLWKWNEPSKAGQAFALDKDQKPISGDLVLDRMYAGPGEPITATVVVWGGEYEATQRTPVPFTATGIISTGGANPQVAAQLAFEPRTAGSPLEKSTTFIPSSLPLLQGRVIQPQLIVTVKAGDRDFFFNRSFRYAATAPFEIKGKKSEGIVNGSLEVRLNGLSHTAQVGGMRVQATLFDAAGKTPISVYDQTIQLSGVGEVPVVLTFFGKTIRDSGIDGPYSIRGLHGIVIAEDDKGMQDVVWKVDQPIVTNKYAAKDFSDKEWNAPEKQQKIKQYQDVIKGFESGR